MKTNIMFYANRDSVVQVNELARTLDHLSATGQPIEIGYDEVSIMYQAVSEMNILENELDAQIDHATKLDEENEMLQSELHDAEREIETLIIEMSQLNKELKKLKNKTSD